MMKMFKCWNIAAFLVLIGVFTYGAYYIRGDVCKDQ